MIFIVLVAFLLSLNTIKLFSLEDMNLFLTVIGLIYGLIAAFTISGSWERFSKIRDAIANEVDALTVLFILSKHMSDRKNHRELEKKIIEYCNHILTTSWSDCQIAEKTHKGFRSLADVVARKKIKNSKDSEIFGKLIDELRDISTSINQQIVLSQSTTPKIQWTLNILLSSILIIGLTFMKMPTDILSIFVVTTMITAIVMILYIIYELDGMKVAEEEVSYDPYKEVIRLVKKG